VSAGQPAQTGRKLLAPLSESESGALLFLHTKIDLRSIRPTEINPSKSAGSGGGIQNEAISRFTNRIQRIRACRPADYNSNPISECRPVVLQIEANKRQEWTRIQPDRPDEKPIECSSKPFCGPAPTSRFPHGVGRFAIRTRFLVVRPYYKSKPVSDGGAPGGGSRPRGTSPPGILRCSFVSSLWVRILVGSTPLQIARKRGKGGLLRGATNGNFMKIMCGH